MNRLILLTVCLAAWLTASADFLGELPGASTVVSGYEDLDSVQRRLRSLPLCPAEGLWQMTADGAVFAIERARPSTGMAPAELRLVMVRPSWRSIRPGTIFGHARPTVKPGVYEAHLYTGLARRTGLSIPRRFTLTIGSEGRLMTFRPFKSPVRLNLWRLLPYLYRRIVTPQQSRPDDLDGAVRIYPESAGHPLSPVYL